MHLFTRIVMLFSWLFMAIGLSFLIGLSLLFDPSLMFELVDLPTDLPAPPMWTVDLASVLSIIAMLLVAMAFWGFHRVLQSATANDFRALAQHLNTCARALFAFWILFVVIDRFMPFLLVLNIPVEQRPEIDWFPLGLELIFATVAIALWAVAGSLQQAAEIEDENRLFL